MSLKDLYTVLRAIRVMEVVGLRTTGNQIANNIGQWSRSTTYRKLSKMEGLGVVRCSKRANMKFWFLTDKGFEVLDAQLELL